MIQIEKNLKPLVSIYIPTHNRCELLKIAINSVLNQTYKNIEILVCDDGSTDETKEYCLEMCSHNKNIKYMRNETPKGACSARNLGIFSASGEYITGLDDDDEFYPGRIQEFVDSFQQIGYPFLCTGLVIDSGEYLIKSNRSHGVIELKALLCANIIGNQVFTKTEYLREIGGFDESFSAWQDYDTWVRLCSKFGHGYKLNSTTYKMNTAHELGRITNSDKSHGGYLSFIAKHKKILSEKNQCSLYLRDLINRNHLVHFHDFKYIKYMDLLVRAVKHNISLYFPCLKKLNFIIKNKCRFNF